MKRFILCVLAILLLVGCRMWVAEGAEVRHLVWNANTEPDLAGYKVYYRFDQTAASAKQGPPFDGTQLLEGESPITYKLVDLEDSANPMVTISMPFDGVYDFVLTAFDLDGGESGFSNHAGWTATENPPMAPTGAAVE